MVRRSTWIVLVVFLLLVGFAFIFQRYQTNKSVVTATATPTTPPVYLYNLGDAKVDEIKVADNTGKNIDLVKNTDTSKWEIKGVPADQADSSQIETVSSELLSLKVEDTLTDTLPLASIGLETPAYTITLKTSTGELLTTFVGMQTAIKTGYYVQDEAGHVLIVNNSGLNELLNLLETPPLLPTATPATTPTEITTPSATPNQVTPTP